MNVQTLYKLFLTLFCLMVLSSVSAHTTPPPWIIAHRGQSAQAPENTLSAISLALQNKAHAIEVDLRLTRDQQVVLLHDAYVNRTTDGWGKLQNMTLEEVRALDAGSWKDPRYSGEKIPLLQEVLALLKERTNTQLILEFKEDSPELIALVLQQIEQQQMQKQVILKSFNKQTLQYIHKMMPEIPLIYVYVATLPWPAVTYDADFRLGSFFSNLEGVNYVQGHQLFLSEKFVQKAQEKGFQVIAWGVDSVRSLRRMQEMGVAAIETDDPAWARSLLMVPNE